LGLFFIAPFLAGQEKPHAPEEKWSRLTPDQKKDLMERYREFKNMKPEEQKELQALQGQLRTMNPEDREIIRQNYPPDYFN
jgi:hypothetical protein